MKEIDVGEINDNFGKSQQKANALTLETALWPLLLLGAMVEVTASTVSMASTASIGLSADELNAARRKVDDDLRSAIKRRKDAERLSREAKEREQRQKDRWELRLFEKARFTEDQRSLWDNHSGSKAIVGAWIQDHRESIVPVGAWGERRQAELAAVDQAARKTEEAAAGLKSVEEAAKMKALQRSKEEYNQQHRLWVQRTEERRQASKEAWRQADREMREQAEKRASAEALAAATRLHVSRARLARDDRRQKHDEEALRQQRKDHLEAMRRSNSIRRRKEDEAEAQRQADARAVEQERTQERVEKVEAETVEERQKEEWRVHTAAQRRIARLEEIRRQAELKKVQDAEAKARFAANEEARRRRHAANSEGERRAYRLVATALAQDWERQEAERLEQQAAFAAGSAKAAKEQDEANAAALAKQTEAAQLRAKLAATQRREREEHEQNQREWSRLAKEREVQAERQARELQFQRRQAEQLAKRGAEKREKREQAASLKAQLSKEAVEAQIKAEAIAAERRLITRRAEEKERAAAEERARLEVEKRAEYQRVSEARQARVSKEMEERKAELRAAKRSWRKSETARAATARSAREAKEGSRRDFHHTKVRRSAEAEILKRKQQLEREEILAAEALRQAEVALANLDTTAVHAREAGEEVVAAVEASPPKRSTGWGPFGFFG